jgi:hypothetical protein
MWASDRLTVMWGCRSMRCAGVGVGVALGPAQGGCRGRQTSGRVSKAEGAVAS